MNGKNIVLLGAAGQLGSELQKILRLHGNLHTITSPRNLNHSRNCVTIDLTDSQAAITHIKTLRPALIVNAAAYTQVDKAESEQSHAFALNTTLPKLLAQYCKQSGITLIHYSSDYVYHQNHNRALKEGEETNPLNYYGASKLAGEQAIVDSHCRHLIFRVSWVYGTSGVNFVKKMIRLMTTRDTLQVVDDQIGAPCSAKMLAASLNAILAKNLHETDYSKINGNGIFNLAPSDFTSWHGLANAIMNLCSKHNHPIRTQNIEAVSSDAFKSPALRPKNSRLDSSAYLEFSGLSIPSWSDSLADEFPQIIASTAFSDK